MDGYRHLIDEALREPVVPGILPKLPAHLGDEGGGTLDRLLEPFGLPSPLPSGR